MSYIWRYFNVSNGGPFTVTTTTESPPSGNLGNGVIDSNSLVLLESPQEVIQQTVFTTAPVMNSITNSGSSINFPSVTTTLIGTNTADNLTNKSLVDNTTFIIDVSDNTKKINFDVTGSTNTITTIASSQTSNITLTLPNANDILVGKATSDVLTNKTLDSTTNTITADRLRSATTTISVLTATAPISGQVLTAISSTQANWQTPSALGEINTASNVGVGGVGIFKQKTGVNLEFRNINAGTSKITITNDNVNNEIDIDVVEANLTLNNIGGTLGVTKGGTGVTTISTGFFLQGNGTSAVSATKAVPTGVVVGTTDSQTLTNKLLSTTTNFFADTTDPTKRINFSAVSASAGSLLTFGSQQTSTQTLLVPNITATDTILTVGTAQTITGSKIFTTPLLAGNISLNNNTSGIAFVNASSRGGTNISSLTITVPSGTIRDYVMIAHISQRNATAYGTLIPPVGWLLIRQAESTDSIIFKRLYLYVRTASTEPANYTWSSISPTTNYIVGAITVFSGVSQFNIVNAEASLATPNSLSHNVPAISTNVPNTMLVAFYSYASVATSWTITGGMTQATAVGSGTAPNAIGDSCVIAYRLNSATGTVGGAGAFTAVASNDADIGLTDLMALTPLINNITTTTNEVFALGGVNATAINLGNQNCTFNAFNADIYTGYANTVGLSVFGAINQVANLIEYRDGTNLLKSGFDSVGQLFIGNNTNTTFFTTFQIPSLSSNTILSFPNITCTVVCWNSVDILTNKTLTATSNVIRATQLGTAGSDVIINTASAPSANQILRAITATSASWQNIITGTTGNVLFNNNNLIGHTSMLSIDLTDSVAILGDNSGSVRPTAPSNGIKVYSRSQAGRRLFAQTGPSGRDIEFQPLLGNNKIGWWSALGNGTTISVINFGNTAVGATGRSVATTNILTSMRRVGFQSAGTAGSSAGTRHALVQFWFGNAPGLGGFQYIARFGLSTTGTVATQRAFVGLLNSAGAIGNVNPSTLVDMIGFGFDSNDSQWTFMHNDASGVATKDVLTGTFSTSNTTICLEARIFVRSNTTTVHYSLEVLNGGSYFEGSTNTNIPSNTTLLSPQIWINNGTTAAAVAIDVVSQYIETDY